ncbi:JAB domain-containing protein [Marinobacter salinexigens]|uniref:JAB domain-containing protein n=1 Tax=Marinobacter salinexigens TaxID=2919747 RepID=A0A5B0VLP3_9GAMM|nr:DNA repair protein RadC [Marinobacter salinexigens]KAA1175602.1 JAB domain-containing protein [Marinobacter salinexigens]
MSDTPWPTDERPRERLLRHGADTLSDAELLAIFLRTGTAGVPVMTMARRLIDNFGGLRGLMTASQRQFCEVRGLGNAKYAQVQAAMEMARRVMDEPLRQGDPLRSPEDTRRFLTSRLGTYPHEVFAGLFLDNRHRVIQYRELFRGTIDGAAVYPREVVRQALEDNAAAVIFAHNHPSGVAEPSQADISLTKRLKEALSLVDIRVLDHMVVGHGEVISLAERGLM